MIQSTRMIIVHILLRLKLHNNEKDQQYLFENTIFNGVIFEIFYLVSRVKYQSGYCKTISFMRSCSDEIGCSVKFAV